MGPSHYCLRCKRVLVTNEKDPGCIRILQEHTKTFDCILCPVYTTSLFRKIKRNVSRPGTGGKGEREQLLTPTVSVWGAETAIPFFISRLQPGGRQDTTPAQSIPTSRAPSKLPWYLVISGCTLSCRTDSSSRCHGPQRWWCSPPQAPSSSSVPCTACSSAGPNSSSCPPRLPCPDSPCLPWPALLGGGSGREGNSLIFREVNSLPR